MKEAALYRRRHADLTDDIDQTGVAAAPTAAALVVQTFTRTTYPTAAQEYYACHTVTLGGAQTEGGAGSLTVAGDCTYVFNAGGSVPPVGTYVIAEPVGGRWVMQYG
jgi:hypothetical protein